MAERLLLEDGFRLRLEDGTSSFLLETLTGSTAAAAATAVIGASAVARAAATAAGAGTAVIGASAVATTISFAATTTFSYTISDGVNQSISTVTVFLQDVIPNAVAQGESVTIVQGQSLLFNVLSNDTPSGVVLDIIVTPPTKGAAVIENNQIRYTPTSGQLGADSLVYRIRLPANNSTATATLSIQINAASGGNVYNWGYPFPEASQVTPARVLMWNWGTQFPAGYSTGDILVAIAPNQVITEANNVISGLRGPLVLCGFTFHPAPTSRAAPFAANYRGIHYVLNIVFDSTATSHVPWLHEANRPAVNWPFVILANTQIDFEVNGCNFGDVMRVRINGSQPINANKQLVGPQSAVFWNKVFLRRAPHYADDEVNSSGAVTGTNVFHPDAIQIFGSTPVVRWADCHIDWVMGQAFFCGRQAEDWGFPRTTRQKYKNVGWVHNVPWGPIPSNFQPANNSPGSVLASPRMVMNFEGGFGASPHELSDYPTGQYWAALFEGQCYIKRIATHASLDVDRFLAPQQGINGRDANGNYQFSNAVQPTHNYPAWNGSIRLLGTGTALPQMVNPSHTGFQRRLLNVDDFLAAIA